MMGMSIDEALAYLLLILMAVAFYQWVRRNWRE
jgi:hypothetical protein